MHPHQETAFVVPLAHSKFAELCRTFWNFLALNGSNCSKYKG